MKFDFAQLSRLGRPKKEQNRYSIGRTSALSAVVLLAFFAVTTFPGYYDGGPSPRQWGMITAVLLAAIVSIRFERSCSSRMGKRPHDWNSSAGSLHAFSFVKCTCAKCGARRVLGYRDGKQIKYLTPGRAVPNSGEVLLYCPYCGSTAELQSVKPDKFTESRVRRSELRKTSAMLLPVRAYRLDRAYIKRYLTVTVILTLAEISSFYIARTSALYLLLPLAIGYFLYVSAGNLVTAAMTAYFVTDDGVYQRIPGGYALFPINAKASLVHFSDGEKLAWGLYTDTENLLISPVIAGWSDMLSSVETVCKERGIPVVE